VRRFGVVFLSSLLLVFPSRNLAIAFHTPQARSPLSASSALVTLPAGTQIPLLFTRPVWAATAKTGDPVYAQTSFPVMSGNGVAIPAGTYVQGTIESVTRPTRRTSRAEIQVLFTQIVFANGYVVTLPGAENPASVQAGGAASADRQPAPGETLIAIAIQVYTTNDLLLDNGAEVEMTLGALLALNADQIAGAVPLSRAPQPGQFQSASLCKPISGSPGTPDTVIPGIPGTPSTTVPGGPGMPDITIPGTPATPPTVIPGTPGSPGFFCPPKPLVLSCTLVVTGNPMQTLQPAASQ
jgi:hypothetical protein